MTNLLKLNNISEGKEISGVFFLLFDSITAYCYGDDFVHIVVVLKDEQKIIYFYFAESGAPLEKNATKIK